MNCNECKANKTVSWAYVELLNDGHKQTIKRLWIALLVLIVMLAATNGLWLYEWMQYDTISYDQDGNGNNIIGDNNRSFYNEPTYEDSLETEQEWD